MISTLVPSLIRTYTPLVVGSLIAWLVSLGVELPAETEAELTIALTAILTGVYYLIARLLEKRWPFLSVLLGSSKIPAQYSGDGVPVITARPEPSQGSGGATGGNTPARLF